ncbi:DUF6236 family protein [Lelliottia amnigena]|uniref:DUF6236 family protein n=1 Tax=Lelliottia amnigena TaxID=61646 RepID=UPI00293C12C7|nr:DUF6236 family protein [Lelliottia amnigena]
MERGVVFTSCELISVGNGNGFQTGRWISALELNYLSLYWDKLVSPTNNIIHTRIHNEDELIQCGLLSRPVYRLNHLNVGEDMASFYSGTHAKTIDILRHSEGNIDWQMYFANEQINLQPDLARNSEVLRFELTNLLPVPPENVPIHEILEFKERRKPELIALHEYLDEVYFEMIRSGDISLQRARSLTKLKKAITDINKLNHEGWRSPIKFDISTSFEFDLSQLYGATAGVFLALKAPHPFDVLGGLGSVVSVLAGSIKIKPQFQSVLATGDKKLAYISHGKSEGIFP